MEEADNSSNTHEIEQIIEKLLNPVAEIRWRALQNILSKLKYGLISMNVLIELQSGKICRYLLKWFLWNSPSQPEFKVVLSFIVQIIKETNNGIRILINESAKNILHTTLVHFRILYSQSVTKSQKNAFFRQLISKSYLCFQHRNKSEFD